MNRSHVLSLIVCGLIVTDTDSRLSADEQTIDLDVAIVSTFLQKHCHSCHGANKQESDLRLDSLRRHIGNAADTQKWQAVFDAIDSGKMPPKDAPQPSTEERKAIGAHLASTLTQAAARFGPGFQYEADDIRIPAASKDEPTVETFNQHSIQAAAMYLDNGAVAWTRSRNCITCHTNGTYMAERPGLTAWFGKPSEEVLKVFQKNIPVKADTTKQNKPRPAYRLIWQTLGLAQWDRYVTKETSELTDRALHAMFMQQRDNGSWVHYTGVRELPHISTDFELAVRAAWAVSAAPGWQKSLKDEELVRRVDRMKTYLREHNPGNDYELALKLQVANFMPDAVSSEHRKEAIAMLRSSQQQDGGWSTRSMSTIDNWANWHPQKDRKSLDMLRAETDAERSASDPYMTGFAIVLLRESGVEASDENIQRGIAWLKIHQRTSGRWWMKSMFKETYHFSTYMGTAQALKALALCGEVKPLATDGVE